MKNNIKKIAEIVLYNEGMQDWTIVWWAAPPSECWADIKQILISESYKDVALPYQYEILLHEISHHVTREHNQLFYSMYAKLLDKYSYLL